MVSRRKPGTVEAVAEAVEEVEAEVDIGEDNKPDTWCLVQRGVLVAVEERGTGMAGASEAL